MKLKIIAKSVYGQTMLYPACDKAKDFLQAMGLKVFTPSAIKAVQALGFELEQVLEKVEL